MKLEEELIRLNEEELFGKPKSVPVEQSEVIKNLATILNILQEAVKILSSRDTIIYEDAEAIAGIQLEVYSKLGEMQDIIEKYM